MGVLFVLLLGPFYLLWFVIEDLLYGGIAELAVELVKAAAECARRRCCGPTLSGPQPREHSRPATRRLHSDALCRHRRRRRLRTRRIA
jgi:hypothetical protein